MIKFANRYTSYLFYEFNRSERTLRQILVRLTNFFPKGKSRDSFCD
jgi:hypothetical protein